VAQREDRVTPTATASSEQHKRTLLIYYYYHYLIVDKYNLEEFKNYKILSWIWWLICARRAVRMQKYGIYFCGYVILDSHYNMFVPLFCYGCVLISRTYKLKQNFYCYLVSKLLLLSLLNFIG